MSEFQRDLNTGRMSLIASTRARWLVTRVPLAILWALTVAVFAVAGAASAQLRVWVPQGPGPSTNGQVEGITDGQVVGAIHALAAHPSNPNTLFVGGVNGGIWRTDNALATSPSWTAQTDALGSLSIGALAFDPTDTSSRTLVAGVGLFSNIGGAGGQLAGVYRTTDGGANWAPVAGNATLANANIAGIAARGNLLVVADTVNGIWRSIDTGASWTRISGALGSGLPNGPSFDLAGVTGTPGRLLTNAGGAGIFRSTDTGATWTAVSTAAMNALLGTGLQNVQISTGAANSCFVAIAGAALRGVFRSGDGGGSWAAMDLPGTTEAGLGFVGIHFGGQAGNNLSLVADPTATKIVYIGGDRQPNPFPNSIGANNFTGRLFRGNAGQPAGSQFVHLTHASNAGAAGGGTANTSAPHADSRDLGFDSNGSLIEVDDGGIYRRTQPQTNAGDWFSMNGNIATTEFHSATWDAVAGIVIGGAQDVGVHEQIFVAEPLWLGVTQADGGAVAVDDISTPGISTRFFSSQNLGGLAVGGTGLQSGQYDSANTLLAQAAVPLTPQAGSAAIVPQFYTPIQINNVNGLRMIVGAQSVYESTDGGATVAEIGVGIAVNPSTLGAPVAYGAADNADMLYVGSGTNVFVRTGPSPANSLVRSAAYPGLRTVIGLAIDPDVAQTAFAVDRTNVFRTTDAGLTWTFVTGDLFASALNPGRVRSVAYVADATGDFLAVGTNRGVFRADAPGFNVWELACAGLPNAPVYALEYDAADKVLVAGTLGRGAWTCYPGRSGPAQYKIKFACGKADGNVLSQGTYFTAINILNPAAPTGPTASYRKSLTIGLPGEMPGGATNFSARRTLAPGLAVEVDCADILREARGLCTADFCKGFAIIDSTTPIEIVAVYTSAQPDTEQVVSLTTKRVLSAAASCPVVKRVIPAQTFLFVPRHTAGDREFSGHGPCVNFELDLQVVDDDTALVVRSQMHAYECSGAFDKPRSDFTTARDSRLRPLLAAGPRSRILDVSVNSNLRQSYIDTNHADDVFLFSAPEPVEALRFVGDTSGDEAGTETGVQVALREMMVTLETCGN